jgi:hypothetical protein
MARQTMKLGIVMSLFSLCKFENTRGNVTEWSLPGPTHVHGRPTAWNLVRHHCNRSLHSICTRSRLRCFRLSFPLREKGSTAHDTFEEPFQCRKSFSG